MTERAAQTVTYVPGPKRYLSPRLLSRRGSRGVGRRASGAGPEVAVCAAMHHENTRIHARSLELIRLVAKVLKMLPVGHGDLGNQVRRASSSIALNFAEGCGHVSPKERARFFGMARASANEVSMIFDVGNAYGVVDDETCARGKDICDHLGGMLYKFH